MMKTLFKMAALTIAAATIFVSCDDTPGTETEIAVERVSLNLPTATITMGGAPLQLVATITPQNATEKGLVWSSDDQTEQFVTVSQTGLVTAVGQGSAIITVTTVDGGKTANCTVTVSPAPIAATGVTLDKEFWSMLPTDELQLVATVEPIGATDSSVTWTSSDQTVATVDTEGNISPLKVGTTTITVTTTDGDHEDECEISINVLGQITFKSSKTWTVGEGTDEQEWSDVVMASGARGKTTFTGANADLRENEGYGDLFSWAAVDTYADIICPDGWRVPSSQDFIDMAVAFGSDPSTWAMTMGLEMDPDVLAALFDADGWGATLDGQCDATGALTYQGSMGYYWSSTSIDGSNANCPYVADMSGYRMAALSEMAAGAKNTGNAVRCVR